MRVRCSRVNMGRLGLINVVKYLSWISLYTILIVTQTGRCCPLCQCCAVRCNPWNACDYSGCIAGYTHNFCQARCSEGCANTSCTRYGGACTPCKAGYWGDKCDQRCGQGCLLGTCNQNNGYCPTCLSGYWSDKCDQLCSVDCSSKSCDKSIGTCLPCPVGYRGTKCVEKCDQRCFTCRQSDGYCSSCNTGYWGDTCERQCNVGCFLGTCDKQTGQCSPCRDGYWDSSCIQRCSNECSGGCAQYNGYCNACFDNYWGNTCESQCSLGCLGNCRQSDGFCYQCKSGLWGNKCEKNCSVGCFEECSQFNGRCVACLIGLWGNICDETCGKGCRSVACNKRNGYCDMCFDGYWGSSCEKECNVGCNGACVKSNGACTCTNGYWGSSCEKKCNVGCNGACARSNGACTCKNGYWGSSCENECTLGCNETCDKITGYCTCEDGYFGDRCTFNCSSECKACISYNGCTSCADGYWGETCFTCDANCVDTCDKDTGNCKCQEGYFNANMNESGCKSCSPKCKNQTCDPDSGACQHGCVDRYWGNDCNHTCSKKCNGTCVQKTGHCIQCANTTVYGLSCDQLCSATCSSNVCERISGHCLLGCQLNYFGSQCEYNCSSNCLEINRTTTRCSYADGTCLHGCRNGFMGDFCDIHHAQAVAGEEGMYAAVGGSVGGVLLIVIIAFIIFVILRRQRAPKKRPHQNDDNNESAIPVDTSPIYATVKKLKEGQYANTSAETLSSVVTLSNPAYEQPPEKILPANTDEPDNNLETDDEDEVARAIAIRFEEKGGIYYNNEEKINNEKVAVADIAQYVAGRAISHYEEEFEKLPYGLIKPYTASQLSANLIMNRYKGIYPYDDNRVKVKGGVTDFINASYIDGYKRRNEFIATLGPMKQQLGDYGAFWRMVWQQNVETIVMLTKLKEEKRDKCDQYWPNINTSQTCGDVTVICSREEFYAEFTHRTFTAEKGTEKRVIHHMHYTSWPDRGVPHDVTTLVDFWHRVKSLPIKLTGPVIVHCSAGIGRTGTYIALDILTKEGRDSGRIDVPGCVLNMRQNRPNMIQTLGQYRYLHHALVHTLTLPWEPVMVDNFPQYMQQNKGAKLHEQFKLLLKCTDPITEDEEEALAINMRRQDKNRPGADIPGEEHRPILHLCQASDSVGYINAIYVNSLKTANRLLLAQTPLPGTVDDFLLLALQERCSCIVNMDPEHIKNKDVGEYFPADNQVLRTGMTTVRSTKDVDTPAYYTKRSLVIGKTGTTPSVPARTIPHLEFTGWVSKNIVPSSASEFCKFVQDVDDLSKASPDGGPIFIVCKNAAERCGLFSAVYLLLEQVTCEGQVSVINVVRKVRAARGLAISCQEQFDFCHKCVLDSLAAPENVYANT